MVFDVWLWELVTKDSHGERLDLGFDFAAGFGASLAEVIFLLEADPEFRAGSEVAAQAQGGVGRNGPATADDGGHAAVRDLEIHGEPVLGDTHRLEEFALENFAGMGKAQRCRGFGHGG